jgi:hypothetical protein
MPTMTPLATHHPRGTVVPATAPDAVDRPEPPHYGYVDDITRLLGAC